MPTRIALLICAIASLVFGRQLAAQAPLAVPAGLPDWTFNIPDKIQPTAVRVEGIVKAQREFPRPNNGTPAVSMPSDIVTGQDLNDVAAYVGE